jgi:hypothetical protein
MRFEPLRRSPICSLGLQHRLHSLTLVLHWRIRVGEKCIRRMGQLVYGEHCRDGIERVRQGVRVVGYAISTGRL